MSALLRKLKHHRVVILVTFMVTAFFLAKTANQFEFVFLDELENLLYDARILVTMPADIDPSIVIVDIDERSLAEVGRWPWSRDNLAHLVNELYDYYGVALIGFDIFFREPDHSSGFRILEQLGKGELADVPGYHERLDELRSELDYDQMFIESIGKGLTVLGFTVFSEEGTAGNIIDGSLPNPVLTSEDLQGNVIHAPSAIGYGANLPEIQENAVGGGHTTPTIDFDGHVRRVPMLVEFQGNYYESLSLAMTRSLLGNIEITPVFGESISETGYPALEGLQLADLFIPVDVNVQALVPFRGRKYSFPYVSAVDVIKGRADRNILEGAMVIIGTSSKGLVDLRPTPVDGEYPGVEIHANLISGILDQRIKHMPAYVQGVEFLQLLMLGLVLSLVLPLLSPSMAGILTLIIAISTIAANFYFWQINIVLPLASSLFLILVIFLIDMSYGFFIERRGKLQLSGLFGQYVPPELVDEMSDDPITYTQDAQSREMSVLFSDVRGFTTISEGLSPDDLSNLMNAYLTPMTKIIHENRGTIDKYIGDAIMAFWNAPIDDQNHANNAVKTGLDMLERTTAIREEFLERGWPEIRIGAGVNTGIMSVGDMGSEFRMAYTVLGDAVNLGSRLEGLTKNYGVELIVSESTKAAADEFVYREIDVVRVKGKVEPVAIFEPLALAAEVSDDEFKELDLHEQAMKNYYAQDWDTSELQFKQLLELSPDRKLYQVYLGRIDDFRQNPPGENWDGVYTFTTK